MTENTTEATQGPTTVRQFRHDARNRLAAARDLLNAGPRTDNTRSLYRLVNGVISDILAGRQGLSQAGQVKQIDRALRQVEKNKESVVVAAEAAQSEVAEHIAAEAQRQVEVAEAKIAKWTERLAVAKANAAGEGETINLAEKFSTALDEAGAILAEAKNFAAERDFTAHQERKGHSVGEDEGPDGGPVDVNATDAEAEVDNEDPGEDDDF